MKDIPGIKTVEEARDALKGMRIEFEDSMTGNEGGVIFIGSDNDIAFWDKLSSTLTIFLNGRLHGEIEKTDS